MLGLMRWHLSDVFKTWTKTVPTLYFSFETSSMITHCKSGLKGQHCVTPNGLKGGGGTMQQNLFGGGGRGGMCSCTRWFHCLCTRS